MCGIIGYSGKNDAKGIIFECLKKLDYRGYDSWGIAVAAAKEIAVVKKTGSLPDKISEIVLPKATVGIGHTRWATHGTVTEKNSHPHLSNNGKIAVVHNGIIENFEKQKEFLKSHGFIFHSETDTETIPNTIEYHMKRGYDFIEAAKRSLKHLEGQYAVIAMDDKGKMAAVRKEAPLVAGIGDNEYFFASDVTAFLEHTRDAIFLEENEMAIIDNGFNVYNMQKNKFVERNISKIEWNAQQAKKGNFDHFYIKEIMEQAEVIDGISKINPALISEIADEIKKAKGVYIVACGTASYACLHGLYMFSKIAKKHINFCVASEFQHFKHFLTDKSLVIAVSQSGETADTLSAIRAAKSMGAEVVSITNTMGSSLMRESHKSILQKAGPEIAVNSTKAYTSQLALLGLIAYEMSGNLDEGIQKLKELSQDIFHLTSENARKFVKTLAEKLKDHEHIYLVGRGLQYPTALEAAHKIKEVSYIHAEAFAAGELKHGPNALITKGTPYIIFTADENEKEIISSAMEVKARGAYVIGVGPKNNEVFDYFIKVREAGDFNSIVQIIPMQILSYQLALLRGCNPDKPRNLAKSVTVK